MIPMAGCRVIAISGTPGSGKTSVSKALARILDTESIDLSELVIREKLYAGYDEDRGSYIIDEERVRRRIRELAEICGDRGKGYLIVEGHYAEIVEDPILEVIVVLRIDPRELIKRLCMRGWGFGKSLENGEAEYIGVCLANALNEHLAEKVCEMNVTGRDLESVARDIARAIRDRSVCSSTIDWTEHIDPQELLETARRYCG